MLRLFKIHASTVTSTLQGLLSFTRSHDSQDRMTFNVLQGEVDQMRVRIDRHGMSVRHVEGRNRSKFQVVILKDRHGSRFGGDVEPLQL